MERSPRPGGARLAQTIIPHPLATCQIGEATLVRAARDG
jgi:hypothetical protein